MTNLNTKETVVRIIKSLGDDVDRLKLVVNLQQSQLNALHQYDPNKLADSVVQMEQIISEIESSRRQRDDDLAGLRLEPGVVGLNHLCSKLHNKVSHRLEEKIQSYISLNRICNERLDACINTSANQKSLLSEFLSDESPYY